MTHNECVREIGRLRMAYPNANIPAETVALYVEMLQGLDVLEMQDAVNRLIVSSKWFPTIAEIRDLVARARTALPSPQEAWCDALRLVRRQSKPEEVHPLVAHCLARLGWRKVSDGGQQQTFIRLFEALAEKARKDELMPEQLRISEDDNKGKAFGKLMLPPHIQAQD